MSAPKPPRFTCPTIDRLKRRIKQAYVTATTSSSDDPEDLKQALKDIAYELRGEAEVLEDIREANTQLRACYEHWEAVADELQTQVDALQQQIAELKD